MKRSHNCESTSLIYDFKRHLIINSTHQGPRSVDIAASSFAQRTAPGLTQLLGSVIKGAVPRLCCRPLLWVSGASAGYWGTPRNLTV